MTDAVQPPSPAANANYRGALYVIAGAFLLTVMASLAKFLGDSLTVPMMVFMRFLAGFIFLLPFIWRFGFANLKTGRFKLHLVRGSVGFLGNMAMFFSIVHIVMADAITIQFSRPLFTVLLAGLFLGEVVGGRRASAAIIGFLGILIITRPFGEGFSPWYFSAIGGAVTATIVVLVVKVLSRTEHTMVIIFYFTATTTVLSAIPALIFWQTPTPTELVILMLMGALGVFGQTLFTHGIGLGETSFVLPFDYLRIVFAFAIGLIWFAEFPPGWSYLGAAIIIVSSYYLLRTERARRSI
ncbi:MAG: DMT family transporter [Rhodospirillales bacterium]|jgi:drug/metabolite transporter (DMT)-like permease|nr:DMT family transporter [Rhodospirillales bacterium]MDP6645352.1 DMT family transporter [Rhodospirillales bacterium]MDP6842829.1 DMT family transporter [Rhodospirillales bacterium]|tara:strand:+ start:339 stop:1229 length:891 start_codon:yes stop_codon:yes gene_type:complete